MLLEQGDNYSVGLPVPFSSFGWGQFRVEAFVHKLLNLVVCHRLNPGQLTCRYILLFTRMGDFEWIQRCIIYSCGIHLLCASVDAEEMSRLVKTSSRGCSLSK